MTLDLSTSPRKLAAALAVALATVALSLPLYAQYQADSYASLGTQSGLQRALELQPRNAEFHNRLGRLLLYTPLADATQTLKETETATQLAPLNGQYWADLALLQEVRGNFAQAAAAIQRARAAEPNTPSILWLEANYLVRRGEEARALERLKALLALSPEYSVRALSFFAKVSDPGDLIENALPRRRDALEAAMEFIRTQELAGPAPQLWKAISTLQEPVSENQLRLFVDWLITRQQAPLARQVWNEAGQRGWLPVTPSEESGALYNAGFEHPLQNFGFDWRVIPHEETSAWIEARGPAPGLQSLCIQFSDDARGDYAHVLHLVTVEPNSSYSLKASLRSDRLMSREGAALTVTSLDHHELARTDSVTGTSHWKEVASVFQTGPQTQMVLLRFVRPAPLKKDDPGSGLACFSDVRWTRLASVAPGGPPRT